MKRCLYVVILGLVMSGIGLDRAEAQNNRFTDRSFVPSPAVLAMGDAGVALPGWDRPVFYNPAQLPQVSSHFTIIGVQTGASRSLRDFVTFFNRRVEPAVAKNFDLPTDGLSALFRDVSALAQHPSRGHGGIMLPAFVYSPGAIGVGGGLYAKTALNYRVDDAGAGVPSVRLVSRTDVMAVGSLGLNLKSLGLPDVSIGVTGKQSRRFLSFKDKPLDTFTKNEAAVLLEGANFELDLGALYTPSWASRLFPGQVRIGAAGYDVLGRGYNYTFGGAPKRMPFLGDVATRSTEVDAGNVAREVDEARDAFRLTTSYRVGIAYQSKSLFIFDDVGVSVDYQHYGRGKQDPLARLHAGIQARVADPLIIRGGLGAGYPSGGFGVEAGGFHFDYAVHGYEEGRVPGQLSTYVHTARITIRIQ